MDSIVVVLVRPQGPVNVGLACRAAANMNAAALRVVAPGALALDHARGRPFACKAAAMWQGIVVHERVEDAVADCDYVLGTTRRRRGGRLLQMEVPAARRALAERKGLVAVVFGSEADGLSDAELLPCDAALVVDVPGEYASLNLSHAVLLALWALQAPASGGGPPAPRGAALTEVPAGTAASAAARRPFKAEAALATSRERRAFSDLLGSALERAGFFAHAARARYEKKMQRVVQAAHLSGPDLRLCAGVVRFLGDRAALAPHRWEGRAAADGDAPLPPTPDLPAGSPAMDGASD